jgi:hypothetical protein
MAQGDLWMVSAAAAAMVLAAGIADRRRMRRRDLDRVGWAPWPLIQLVAMIAAIIAAALALKG